MQKCRATNTWLSTFQTEYNIDFLTFVLSSKITNFISIFTEKFISGLNWRTNWPLLACDARFRATLTRSWRPSRADNKLKWITLNDDDDSPFLLPPFRPLERWNRPEGPLPLLLPLTLALLVFLLLLLVVVMRLSLALAARNPTSYRAFQIRHSKKTQKISCRKFFFRFLLYNKLAKRSIRYTDQIISN